MSEQQTSNKPAAWEQLPHESSSAYHAFSIYRSLPPGERSIDEAYRRHAGKACDWQGRAPGHVNAWASDNDWVERAMAYDAHLDEAVRAADLEEHIDQLRLYRERALTWAGRADAIALDLLERIEAAVGDLSVGNANDAARVARAARELMDSASGARAQALTVEELLDALDRE